SASDIAFHLESLSGVSMPAGPTPFKQRRPARRWVVGLGGLALLIAAAFGGFLTGRRAGPTGGAAEVIFTPLTYRPVPIFRAAFAPDGRTVVYSAAPEGNSPEVFVL